VRFLSVWPQDPPAFDRLTNFKRPSQVCVSMISQGPDADRISEESLPLIGLEKNKDVIRKPIVGVIFYHWNLTEVRSRLTPENPAVF
jgi:hypothetical protein